MPLEGLLIDNCHSDDLADDAVRMATRRVHATQAKAFVVELTCATLVIYPERLLGERQLARFLPSFLFAPGVPRVNGRRVVSGIVYVIRNGLQWKDAHEEYSPHKTLYNSSCAGAGWACATGSSLPWRVKVQSRSGL
jgi:hypothetical protein